MLWRWAGAEAKGGARLAGVNGDPSRSKCEQRCEPRHLKASFDMDTSVCGERKRKASTAGKEIDK